jgi:hypothetical protein
MHLSPAQINTIKSIAQAVLVRGMPVGLAPSHFESNKMIRILM